MKDFRKNLLRKIMLYILPYFGYLFIKFLYKTNMISFHLPKNIPEENFIYLSWHDNLLMIPYLYLKLRNNKNTSKVIISEHFDGKLVASTMKNFGFIPVHGSTRKMR